MATPLRVLILEDRPADAELMALELRRAGLEPAWRRVETEEDYLSALDPGLDLILADYTLPQFDALRALHLLQEGGLDIPFIVVTGTVSEEVAAECVKQGAADYLLKDRLARLGPAVENALQERKLRQEKRRAEESLGESQWLLQAVVDTAPSLIVLTDSEGRIVLFNRACEELTGYWRDEVIGNTIAELFLPPEWIPVVQKRFADPYAPEVRAPHKNPWLTKAGEQRLIEWRCTPLPWDGGGTYILGTGIDVTDREQAEEALRQAEANYRSLFEEVPIGLYRSTPEGQLLAVNPALVEMLGFPDWESLLAVNAADGYVNVEDREREMALVERDGVTQSIEIQVRRYDGTPIWARDTTRPVRDADGRTLYYEGSLEDISEWKRAEEELRRRAAHLEALNAVIAAAAAATDLPALLETALEHTLCALGLEIGAIWVPGLRAIRGVSAELCEAIGTAARVAEVELVGPVVLGDVGQAPAGSMYHFAEMFTSRLGLQSTLTVPVLIGETRVGGISVGAALPRPWPAEEVALLEAVGQQLGGAVERLRLLEQVQEQARRVQQIMDTMPEGVLLLDGERRIVMANPAARECLAVLSEAKERDPLTHLAGRPIEELLAPPPPGQYHEVEIARGTRRIFEVLAQPVTTETEAGGWVLLLRDVTWERERHWRIAQQERLAATGQLVAGIAHDFNNVLQGILSFAETLQQKPGMPETAQDPLRLICLLAERAGGMNRQLLDFSRQSIAERKPLDLLPFAKEMVHLLRRTIPEKIEITLEHAPGEYRIQADVAQLQQVLLNLAANARDAMPDGGRLSLRLTHYTSPADLPPDPGVAAGEWIRLEVSDTGSGISPEILPHIFEPFFTTKDRSQGTGLGLAQVYGIVTQHEGRIDVSTKLDQGTTFTLYLPMLEDKGPAGRGFPQIATGQGETILLVEDDPTVLDSTRAELEQLRYRVLTAADGQEGLQVYDHHRAEIRLVLTDLVLPKMDGVALLRALRAGDPALPIVVMTGYPLTNETQDMFIREGTPWLEKPVALTRLAQVLKQALAPNP